MQSRRFSLIESVSNVVIGYCVAVITQAVVFPVFDIYVAACEHAGIASIFTIVSLVRSYVIRRLFNGISL